MLARIARELFWLGRNVSRAEHTSRLLDGASHADLQALPDAVGGVRFGWGSILAVLGEPAEGASERPRGEVLRTLTLAEDRPASIVSCVARAREGARTVRDVISAEMWEALNTTDLELRRSGRFEGWTRTPDRLLRYVNERAALFWGLTHRTMLRDEARAFLVAGREFESVDMILRMLQVALPPGPKAFRDGRALALLRAVGGLQAYRRSVPLAPDADLVASFLLFEAAYPDAVAAGLRSLRASLAHADENPRSSEPVLRLDRLSADLEFRSRAGESDVAQVCEIVMGELAQVDRAIADRYFSGAASPPGVVHT